jgi:hypothetical protein
MDSQVHHYIKEGWWKDFLKLAYDQGNVIFEPFQNIYPYISTA